jgi:hypothetical protein
MASERESTTKKSLSVYFNIAGKDFLFAIYIHPS